MGDYRTQARDTSPEVDGLLVKRYREMTPAEKVQMVRDLSRAVETFEQAGLRLRYPDANEEQLRRRLAEQRLSRSLLSGIRPGDIDKLIS